MGPMQRGGHGDSEPAVPPRARQSTREARAFKVVFILHSNPPPRSVVSPSYPSASHTGPAMDDSLSFLYAAATGDLPTIKRLYHTKKSILVIKNPDGRTALHLAASHQQTEVLELLSTYGICASATDNRGQTALHIAAQGSSTEAAGILLRIGSGCSTRDKDGHKPIFYAYENPNVEMLARFQQSAPACGGGCTLTPDVVLRARASRCERAAPSSKIPVK
ncbi:ankyrin repeat-containing domain protein [Aspergillus crustosus]